MVGSNTFGRSERLKSQKRIEALFSEGTSITKYPLRLVYLKQTEGDFKIKTAVSVGKKHFKSAVDRNRIKRLMREAYRLQKASLLNNISDPYALMILYIGNDGTNFDAMYNHMKRLLSAFVSEINTS